MAQRRKRYYPALKSLFKTFLLLSGVSIMSFSCQKAVLKGILSFHPKEVWMWGGDAGRKGQSIEELRPPLKQAWRKKVNGAVDQAIAAVDSFLIFGTKAGEITILDVKSGQSLRTLKIEKKVEVTCLIDDDRLIAVQRWNKPSLQSIDFLTGKRIWQVNQGSIVGEPLLGDEILLASNSDGLVFALNVRNGEMIWRRKLETPVRSSLVSSGKMICGVGEGGRIWALSKIDGEIIWNKTFNESFQATPVLSNDRLYVGSTNGRFYCLSLKTGEEIWQRTLVGGVYHKAAMDDEIVYIGTTQGICYALDAEYGDQRWLYETQSVIGTPPVISGRFLYFGVLDRTLYALVKKSGQSVWQTELRARIRTTPLVWQGHLIVSSEDRHVYGYEAE